LGSAVEDGLQRSAIGFGWTLSGFSRSEVYRIQKLVEEHKEELLRSWNEYFRD